MVKYTISPEELLAGLRMEYMGLVSLTKAPFEPFEDAFCFGLSIWFYDMCFEIQQDHARHRCYQWVHK